MSLLGLRILQSVITIPIIGFAAAILDDFSNASIHIPGKATAAEAVACVCIVYVALSFLPIFFEGALFFTTCMILDALFLAGWITLTAVWDSDGTGSCVAFNQKYFNIHPPLSYDRTDCRVVKAMYAFMIINL